MFVWKVSVDYIHFMPFKNLLKFRKVKMAKYIYMWENVMQWCEELFTSSQVFFQGKKNNWSSNTIRIIFILCICIFLLETLSAYFPPKTCLCYNMIFISILFSLFPVRNILEKWCILQDWLLNNHVKNLNCYLILWIYGSGLLNKEQ